jgi:hypothetical protein
VLSEGKSLAEMAEAIISAFVQAKFRHIDASVGLYAISDDVEGKRIAQAMHARVIHAMTTLLGTVPEARIANAEVVASTLLSAMTGVSRVMLERGCTRATMTTMEHELKVMVRAYLEASASGPSWHQLHDL